MNLHTIGRQACDDWQVYDVWSWFVFSDVKLRKYYMAFLAFFLAGTTMARRRMATKTTTKLTELHAVHEQTHSQWKHQMLSPMLVGKKQQRKKDHSKVLLRAEKGTGVKGISLLQPKLNWSFQID